MNRFQFVTLTSGHECYTAQVIDDETGVKSRLTDSALWSLKTQVLIALGEVGRLELERIDGCFNRMTQSIHQGEEEGEEGYGALPAGEFEDH